MNCCLLSSEMSLQACGDQAEESHTWPPVPKVTFMPGVLAPSLVCRLVPPPSQPHGEPSSPHSNGSLFPSVNPFTKQPHIPGRALSTHSPVSCNSHGHRGCECGQPWAIDQVLEYGQDPTDDLKQTVPGVMLPASKLLPPSLVTCPITCSISFK